MQANGFCGSSTAKESGQHASLAKQEDGAHGQAEDGGQTSQDHQYGGVFACAYESKCGQNRDDRIGDQQARMKTSTSITPN